MEPQAMAAVLQALARRLSPPMASHAPVAETTRLTPAEEQAFWKWARANGVSDVDAPESRYDYRGYWRQSGGPPMQFGVDHFPDTFKQHGHPLFSNESQYARGPSDGGRWLGEALIAPPMASHGLDELLASLRR